MGPSTASVGAGPAGRPGDGTGPAGPGAASAWRVPHRSLCPCGRRPGALRPRGRASHQGGHLLRPGHRAAAGPSGRRAGRRRAGDAPPCVVGGTPSGEEKGCSASARSFGVKSFDMMPPSAAALSGAADTSLTVLSHLTVLTVALRRQPVTRRGISSPVLHEANLGSTARGNNFVSDPC